MTDPTPQVLAGRYEIRELIGRGGMAEVHLGYDTRLSRVIAIKLLRSDIAGDPTFQARFRREAQSAAALNHPAIVAVYDSGEEVLTGADGVRRTVPYIVMEYVEGHTVRELLGEGEAVPINEAVEIVTGVLDALEYSHRAGIVHRDIKPGNIMLTSTGAVKVMDFGIARAVEDSAAQVTQAHAVVGTAQYLSPEQARGEVVDARSDLYSTGCLLYELLTGTPPFTGDSAVAIAYQHVREIPRPPSAIAADVPDSLDRVVLKALAKTREDRYQDAAHMRSDLMAAWHGGTVGAPGVETWNQPTTVLTPTKTSTSTPLGISEVPSEEESSKRPWWFWALIVALLVVVGSAIGVLVHSAFSGSDTPTPSATQTSAPVPDVAGMSEQQARAAIEAAGLVFVKGDDVASDSVEQGKAVSSEPGANTNAVLGTKIIVHFSAGSAMVSIPDVSGKDQEAAKTALEDAGLKVGDITTEDSATVDKDLVIRTDPTAGTSVQRGSTVSLVIASGRTSVPDLSGMTQDQARAALEEAGLSVGDVTQEDADGAAPGTVLRSSPANGATVERGSEVSLVLASGNSTNVQVPSDIVGKSRDDAINSLRKAGFTNIYVQTSPVTDKSRDGEVTQVAPGAGSVIAKDTAVTITVGAYQE